MYIRVEYVNKTCVLNQCLLLFYSLSGALRSFKKGINLKENSIWHHSISINSTNYLAGYLQSRSCSCQSGDLYRINYAVQKQLAVFLVCIKNMISKWKFIILTIENFRRSREISQLRVHFQLIIFYQIFDTF